jgi:hypothetical protein
MNRLFLISLVLLFALSAFGQGGFDTVTPAQPIAGDLQISTTSVYVSGHWDALDGQPEPPMLHGKIAYS